MPSRKKASIGSAGSRTTVKTAKRAAASPRPRARIFQRPIQDVRLSSSSSRTCAITFRTKRSSSDGRGTFARALPIGSQSLFSIQTSFLQDIQSGLAGAAEAGFKGLQETVEDAGRFFVGQTFHLEQDQRRAGVLREGIQKLLRYVGRFQGRRRIGGRVLKFGEGGFGRFRAARAGAQDVHAVAVGDPADPSQEGRVPAVAAQAPIRLEKDLLGGVFGRGSVGEEGGAEPDQPRVMATDQLRVRLPIPLHNLTDDVAVFFDWASPISFAARAPAR